MVRKKLIKTIHLPLWLLILLILVFILRIPSFFEPFSYGDEMIYLTLGQAIRRGLVLYKDIHDNKPPLLYFLAAIAGNVFWFRAILAGWMTITTIIFWHLTQKIFPKEKAIQTISTIAFAILTTIPLLEGQIANAELFMVGLTVTAFLLLYNQPLSIKKSFSAGLLFSFATLFKVPAAFDIGTIIFFWLIFLKLKPKPIRKFIINSLSLTLGLLIPVTITLIWYYFRGAFNEYLVAAFLQNVGYLSSWRPEDIQQSFLAKNAPLLARGVLILSGSALLYFFRKKLSPPFIFSSLWLLFALFAVTLSERPYPHYLLQAVPPISLLIGILFARKSLEQSLAIIPLLLATFTPVYFNFWYYPSLPYYQRFFKLATNKISKEEYFNQFNKNTTSNYQLAEFITSSSRPEDKIFVWGPDSSTIYALTRHLPPIKYVATYHINDFSSPEEVITQLEKNKPTFIIILPGNQALPGLLPFLYTHYLEVDSIDNIQIWKLANPVVMKLIR
jgi:hypothetical protein